MTRLLRVAAGLALALAVWPSQGSAQTLGGGVYVGFGQMRFSASQTFEAVVGSAEKSNILVGGSVTGIWRGIFADAGVTQVTLEGQRVFVDGGDVFPLGIATTIRMRPIDLAGGWRSVSGRLSPYAGAGITVMSYSESSDFAEPGEDVEETKTGPVFLAGIDVEVVRYVRVGGELRYRSIGGVLGSDGVSAAFGEDQLGGFSFALRISVGR